MEMAERQLALDKDKLALDEGRRLHTTNLIQDATTAMGAISALKDLKKRGRAHQDANRGPHQERLVQQDLIHGSCFARDSC